MSTSDELADSQVAGELSAPERLQSVLSHGQGTGTGTRTPRKVQWAENTKGDDPTTTEDYHHHHLDEQGLDVRRVSPV